MDVARPLTQKSGPGLEALKLAVHRPEEVAGRLHAVLFSDPLQRGAFDALVHHDDLHDAIDVCIARSGRAACAGSPSRSRWPETPSSGIRLTWWSACSCARPFDCDCPRSRRPLAAGRILAGRCGGDRASTSLAGRTRRSGSVRGAADRLVAWLMEREPKEG